MMVLDLRPFDIVEGVSFNELFKLVSNPFPNPNSFGNPDKFKNLEKISRSRSDSSDKEHDETFCQRYCISINSFCNYVKYATRLILVNTLFKY